MSGIVAELERASGALARPTLRLLNGPLAALRVAVFRASFSRDQRSVPADLLHSQIETYLVEMQHAGYDVPAGGARTLCNTWVKDQWLLRDKATDTDTIVYSLTSASLEALDLVQSLSRDRALVSESRLSMILETVRRWAVEASPDAGARVALLNARIQELEQERDRILEFGVAEITDDRMVDGYANLMDLVGQLPSDFKRVEESVLGMHRKIMHDLREDDSVLGAVLGQYLDDENQLLRSTPEGRAFVGAFVLLRNADLLDDLRDNVQVLLDHPAAAALDARDIAEIRGMVAVIRRGTEDVLEQRRRLSRTLKEHIVHRDAVVERELDLVLRGLERELFIWMETAGPLSKVDIDLLPAGIELGHLKDRLWDPASAAPPPPLSRPHDDIPAPPSIAELRAAGGPSLPELRAAVIEAVNRSGQASIGEVFHMLPPELRRPVEILGLLYLASTAGEPDPDAAVPTDWESYDVEDLDAIRPDGRHRTFRIPQVILTPAHAAALAADEDEETADA